MDINKTFKFIETLGKGCFAKVKKAIHKKTGEFVAIKVIKKCVKNPKEAIKREINIHKILEHPNIIMLYNVYEDEKNVYLIQELAENGNLYEYIWKNEISIENSLKIFYQIIEGLEYIHKKKIAHRDIKPHNILFDNKFNVKITDFGLSNFYDQRSNLKTPCGSAFYVAPNILIGKPYEPMSTDIWSSGIILFKILTGDLPFNTSLNCKQDLFKKILKGKFLIPNYLNKNIKQLILGILKINPLNRFNFWEIKNHEALKNAKYTILKNKNKINKNTIKEKIQIKLKNYNFNIFEVKNNLKNNKLNEKTMIYKIIYKIIFWKLSQNNTYCLKNKHTNISMDAIVKNQLEKNERIFNFEEKNKKLKINKIKKESNNKIIKINLKNNNNNYQEILKNKKNVNLIKIKKNNSFLKNTKNKFKYSFNLDKKSKIFKSIENNKKMKKDIYININSKKLLEKRRNKINFFRNKRNYNISLINKLNNRTLSKNLNFN